MSSHKSKINSSKGRPWITEDLKKRSRKKNTITNSIPSNIETYKKYKNKFIADIRKAKKKYYAVKFTQASNDIKSTWNLTNHLLNRKKSAATAPAEMRGKESVLSNPNEIADGFNTFFVNVGSDLASSILDTNENPCNLIKGQYSPLNTFVPPTSQEVHNIIMELKNSAPGHDGIKSILIKETIDHLIQPITHILSLSLQSGIIPLDLKIAKVIPVFKTGDTHDFGNYRPISILPCISKLLENLVYARISKHLTVNKILYAHQYGFRKKHSTEHALIQLTNIISTAMDNSKFAFGSF